MGKSQVNKFPKSSVSKGKRKLPVIVDEEVVVKRNRRGNLTYVSEEIQQPTPSVNSRASSSQVSNEPHQPPNSGNSVLTPPREVGRHGFDEAEGTGTRQHKQTKVRPSGVQQSLKMSIADAFIPQSQNDFLREWKPLRQQYLNELLITEELPSETCSCGRKENLLRCTDCFVTGVTCRTCCLAAHKHLPFHRVQSWNGKYFKAASLYSQGHVIHVGHRGTPCPNNYSAGYNHNKDTFVEVLDLDWEEEEEEDLIAAQEDVAIDVEGNLCEDDMVIVHTTGIFQQRIRWCTCPGCPQTHIQLFRMGLFSCSQRRPRTAFTFDVLDHFYIDAMECKTAGQSFYNKLRRLTNNAFPHMVPVRLMTSSCLFSSILLTFNC
jgi:hypothetical protein